MKVLIVDDEVLIREWLQFCIKDIPNLEIVGSASNGADALAIFQQVQAEIILTDIKMPIMDGIELLHEIRKISKDCIVILLTAFSEFEYARAAVREGASEYILKTEISAESLKEIISKTTAQFSKKDMINIKEENDKALRSMLFKHDVLTIQDIELLKEKKFMIEHEDIFVIALLNRHCLKKISMTSAMASNIYMFEYDHIYSIIIGNIHGGNTDFEKLKLLQSYAKGLHKKNGCKIGCSEVKRDIKDLPGALIEATTSLSNAFYDIGNDIYLSKEKDADIRDRLDRENILLNQFYKAFLPMSGNEQQESLENMLTKIEEEKFLNIAKVISFCKEILELLYANDMNKHDSLIKNDLEECLEQINESFSFKKTKEIMLNFTHKNIYIDTVNNQNLSKGLQLALQYIREHYHETLSLVDIAEYVHLSPDYFSRIFKEETGQTYIAYLTYIRLSKACKMLINTNFKVQEIAEAVGYSNVSYFSTVFKKQYDCNPYEFRRGERK